MNKCIVLLLSVALLAGCGPKTFHYGAQQTALPQLAVQAEGQVMVNPDQMQLRLGVVTEAETTAEALKQNNQRMAAIMQMLEEIGITAAELATGQFQIQPEWSRPPRPTPANWQREIIGYRVSNELLVTSTQIELAGKLFSLGQQAGANQVGGLQFGLADPTAHQQKAIEEATLKAIRKAQTMATAAGVKLGAVQSISLGSDVSGGQPRLMMAEARTASVEAVPVTAGKVEVSAVVKMIYLLEEIPEQAQ